MKRIYLALSLALFLFAACGNQPTNEDVTELSQDYLTMSEDQPAIFGEIKLINVRDYQNESYIHQNRQR